MFALRFLVIVFIVFGSLIPATQPAQAGTDVAWNVTCGSTKSARNDPIVFPKQFGASHMHTFYGNTTTDANTTTASLLASGPSSCERGFQDADHSAYWIPSLYRRLANGSFEQIQGTPKDVSMTIYYRRAGGAAGDKISPFPQGLRMIAGDATATTPQKNIAFRCINNKNGGTQTKNQSTFPDCTSDQHLMGDIRFPNCWDGKNLDSADHKSHMAYSNGKTQSCPADHPVKVPQLTYEPRWNNVNGAGSQYMLSSGGPYSLHGDFFAAWDSKVQQALVDQCTNAGKQCTFKKLDDLKLGVAPTSTGGGKVLADSKVAEPKINPASAGPTAKPLPATGPIETTSGAIGLLGMGFAYHVYRLRRRDLRDALMHPRQGKA